jgi:hypothetical protein
MRQLRVDERVLVSGASLSWRGVGRLSRIDSGVFGVVIAKIHVDRVGRATCAIDTDSRATGVKFGYHPYTDKVEKCAVFVHYRPSLLFSSAC